MVASRCTGVPSSRPNASVSASHSWGTSAATCATGQWCWQSCSPARPPIAGAGPAEALSADGYAASASAWTRLARLPRATAGAYLRSRSDTCLWANSAIASGPAVSARKRSALVARSS